jgi:plasmid stability protein
MAKAVIEKLTQELDLSLPESIHAALKAESVAFDKSMQDIAREILQEWADRKHLAYKVYARLVLANGMQTELPGFETEDVGKRRDGRK